MLFKRKRKKTTTKPLRLNFYYQEGTFVSTTPPIIWNRRLYDVVFGDQDFIKRITSGLVFVKQTPDNIITKPNRDIINLYDYYTDMPNIANVVGIDYSGIEVNPIEEYEYLFKNHNKLVIKPIFVRLGDDILFVCFNLVRKIERV